MATCRTKKGAFKKCGTAGRAKAKRTARRSTGGSATVTSSHRQSITTKYHGPTNSTGSRISARSESGQSLRMPYRYELNTEKNHEAACKLLADKLGWGGHWVGGGIKGGYVFVDVSGVR